VDVDDSATGDEISHNSVFSNGGLGIDLGGAGEGKKFTGEVVSDSEDGLRSFTFSPATSVPVGRTITATATRGSTHDTPEFSAPKAVASSLEERPQDGAHRGRSKGRGRYAPTLLLVLYSAECMERLSDTSVRPPSTLPVRKACVA
jgi:hypothetical protein